MKDRGRLYWSPAQVRVWVNGRFLDLGPRSLESSRIVADKFGFRLMVRGSTTVEIEGKGPSVVSTNVEIEGRLTSRAGATS